MQYAKNTVNRTVLMNRLASLIPYTTEYRQLDQKLFLNPEQQQISLDDQQKQYIQTLFKYSKKIFEKDKEFKRNLSNLFANKTQKINDKVMQVLQQLQSFGISEQNLIACDPEECKEIPAYAIFYDNDRTINVVIKYSTIAANIIKSDSLQIKTFIYNEFVYDLAQVVTKQVIDYANLQQSINITGIQQGGSIAAIVTQQLHQLGYNVRGIVFGPCPCMGYQAAEECQQYLTSYVYNQDENVRVSDLALTVLEYRIGLIKGKQQQLNTLELLQKVINANTVRNQFYIPGYIMVNRKGNLVHEDRKWLAEFILTMSTDSEFDHYSDSISKL